jgi:hypothetical protein
MKINFPRYFHFRGPKFLHKHLFEDAICVFDTENNNNIQKMFI